jgi:hypothetical protein
MVAYLKAFVAYLKAYVFSKFSGWQSMKSMTVSSMECVSILTRSTWAAVGHSMTHLGPPTGSMRVQDDDRLPGELP